MTLEREHPPRNFEDFAFEKAQPILGRVLLIHGTDITRQKEMFYLDDPDEVFRSIMKNGLVSPRYAYEHGLVNIEELTLEFEKTGINIEDLYEEERVWVQVTRTRDAIQSEYSYSLDSGFIFLVNRDLMDDIRHLDDEEAITVNGRVMPEALTGIVLPAPVINTPEESEKQRALRVLDSFTKNKEIRENFEKDYQANPAEVDELTFLQKLRFLKDLGSSSWTPAPYSTWMGAVLTREDLNDFFLTEPSGPIEKQLEKVNQLVGAMKEASGRSPELALPIYSNDGQLLWPKKMTHEELVRSYMQKLHFTDF